jgi:hypothetical protein
MPKIIFPKRSILALQKFRITPRKSAANGALEIIDVSRES